MSAQTPGGLEIFPDDARRVLAFWFDQPLDAPEMSLEQRARLQKDRPAWFKKSDEFDMSCRHDFGGLCEAALAGELDSWAASADASLARIILLDQITRNIFRGTPRAFAGDAAALQSSQELVNRGALDHLTPFEQVFVLLAYEHAESIDIQQESVRLFEALAARYPQVEKNADYARRHRDVIMRFGRFPHRNAMVGRTSTSQEIAFLKGPNSSF